jgi:prostatic aicd phosphatase
MPPLRASTLFLISDFRNENVLGNTATAFLQGFYPPSDMATTDTLTNGTSEVNPLNGYQYVLVNGMPSTAPDSIWLKGDMFCPAMTNASKAYYESSEFLARQTELQPFYDKFTPLLQGVFPQSQIGFQSAYGIFDYLNVGFIHNATIFADLSPDDLFQLKTLADNQELALVYNESNPLTSVGGKTLSGVILTQLNKTASGVDNNLRVTYMAASYSVFQAFFGISGLLDVSNDFHGLPEYASTMSFELRKPDPSTDDTELFVRYGFRNGSDPSALLNTYPLFGRTKIEEDIPWSQFVSAMTGQGILSQKDWCQTCVSSNLTFCAAYPSYIGRTSAPQSDDGHSVSPVAAGFIGAGVTIAFIAGIEGLAVLVWFVRKRLRNRATGEKLGSDTASDRAAYI